MRDLSSYNAPCHPLSKARAECKSNPYAFTRRQKSLTNSRNVPDRSCSPMRICRAPLGRPSCAVSALPNNTLRAAVTASWTGQQRGHSLSACRLVQPAPPLENIARDFAANHNESHSARPPAHRLGTLHSNNTLALRQQSGPAFPLPLTGPSPLTPRTQNASQNAPY